MGLDVGERSGRTDKDDEDGGDGDEEKRPGRSARPPGEFGRSPNGQDQAEAGQSHDARQQDAGRSGGDEKGAHHHRTEREAEDYAPEQPVVPAKPERGGKRE